MTPWLLFSSGVIPEVRSAPIVLAVDYSGVRRYHLSRPGSFAVVWGHEAGQSPTMPSSYPYAAVQPLRRGEHTYSRVIVPRFSLPHTVDIYRNADIRLDAGDRVPVGLADMTPLYRRVRCWVQPETAQQVLEFQRLALPIIHQVTFFMNPGIINGDYLLFQGSRILVVEGIKNSLEVDILWSVSARELVA